MFPVIFIYCLKCDVISSAQQPRVSNHRRVAWTEPTTCRESSLSDPKATSTTTTESTRFVRVHTYHPASQPVGRSVGSRILVVIRNRRRAPIAGRRLTPAAAAAGLLIRAVQDRRTGWMAGTSDVLRQAGDKAEHTHETSRRAESTVRRRCNAAAAAAATAPHGPATPTDWDQRACACERLADSQKYHKIPPLSCLLPTVNCHLLRRRCSRTN